jgi:hypothetical protein
MAAAELELKSPSVPLLDAVPNPSCSITSPLFGKEGPGEIFKPNEL